MSHGLRAKLLRLAVTHKVYVIAGVLVIGVGGVVMYNSFSKDGGTVQYVSVAAERGSLITSVSGSGQVTVLDQIDLKPEVAGTVTGVLVKNGQEVKQDEVLVQIDAAEAYKAVQDAQINLETAQLSLERLKKGADELTVMQAENSLASARDSLEKLKLTQMNDLEKAQDSKQKAADALVKAYEDSFNTVSNAFLDLPTIMAGLNDGLYGTSIGDTERSLGMSGQPNGTVLINSAAPSDRDKLSRLYESAVTDYLVARKKYDGVFGEYKATNRFASQEKIETLLSNTIEVVKLVAQSAKSQSNVYDAWVESRTQQNWAVLAKVKELQTLGSGYVNKSNSHISSMLSVQRSLTDSREAIKSAERELQQMTITDPRELAAAEANVREREASLAKLKAGPDVLDLRSQELTVRQRQAALAEARSALADHTIKAPIAGVITNVVAKKGATVGSGSAVATLLAKQKIAEITLNEVDVAKVKVGQKTTLTFDALTDYNLTGEVIDIDAIGTVSQGVVSYTVTIAFDAQDDRIKPGMSVSATIITDIKQNVVMVPSAAVKFAGAGAYVEILKNEMPESRTVTVGSANDTMTEIVSGIEEGEVVVTQTIQPTASTAAGATGGIPGLGGLGGTVRINAGAAGNGTFRGGNVLR